MILGLYQMLSRAALAGATLVGSAKARRGDPFWQGRLGSAAGLQPVDIWLHAASVGETGVIGNLVNWLCRNRPELRFHVTIVTRTGMAAAASQMAGRPVSFSYFPIDAAPAVARLLESLRPRVTVVAETEIWPNFILAHKQSGLPLVLVNGRMSERAQKRYRVVRRSFGRLLAVYDRFFFKSDDDAARYRTFGVPAERCEVAGDMKFDAEVLPRSDESVRSVRQEFGLSAERSVVVAGSTRPGEEEILLDSYRTLLARGHSFQLVLAPRHLERMEQVEHLIVDRGLAHSRLSAGGCQSDIVLVDSMGQLVRLYRAADLSFVGGTLVPLGGHNLLEPVYAGCPVLFGPSIDNVRDAAGYILGHRLGAQAASPEELLSLLEKGLSRTILFHTKQPGDMAASATARAGRYLLSLLDHA